MSHTAEGALDGMFVTKRRVDLGMEGVRRARTLTVPSASSSPSYHVEEIHLHGARPGLRARTRATVWYDDILTQHLEVFRSRLGS